MNDAAPACPDASIAAQNAQNAPSASTMLDAGRAFLAALDPAQKSSAVFPFNSDERFRWFYTPVSRKGIPLKKLSATQRRAALALLRAGLSEQGYTKAETIRKLEDVLREIEQGSGLTRDRDLYFFTFFGELSDSGAWGWCYEGQTTTRIPGITSTPAHIKTCSQARASVRPLVTSCPGRRLHN